MPAGDRRHRVPRRRGGRPARRRGFDLEVLTTDRTGKLPRTERVDGYLVRRFRAYPAGRDWYFSPGLFWAALRARYDVVHVQGVHTLVPPLAMIAAIVRRTPFLLTFHTGGNSSAFREKARAHPVPAALAAAAPRAHADRGLRTTRRGGSRRSCGLPEGAITVIRNGGSLPPVRAAVTPEPGLVVSVGRLERYKGHHKAIEALPHLLERHPEARVEILGAGPYEPELRALADELGVGDRVTIRFIPPMDRSLMADCVARAGVMTLLSDYEAHPVAVMEALTAGRPAVVSRTSGLTELADLGWAVGVDQHAAPAETARAIERQLSDPLLPDASAFAHMGDVCCWCGRYL